MGDALVWACVCVIVLSVCADVSNFCARGDFSLYTVGNVYKALIDIKNTVSIFLKSALAINTAMLDVRFL